MQLPPIGNGRLLGLAAGSSHTCALVDDPDTHGTVYCWGDNRRGQLGDGTQRSRAFPSAVRIAARIVQVTAGAYHTCALSTNGRIFCWGGDFDSELGAAPGRATCTCRLETYFFAGSDYPGGMQNCDPNPREVARPNPTLTFSQVAAGSTNTCALSTTGTVWCWGRASAGVLGAIVDGGPNVNDAMTQVPGLTDVVQIALTSYSAVALLADGSVWTWGANYGCTLGVEDSGLPENPRPARVASLSNIVQVTARGDHACALDRVNRIWCWGLNMSGELGVDHTAAERRCSSWQGRAIPVQASGPPDAGMLQQIAVSGSVGFVFGHTCVLTATQEIWCWGDDSAGQLGTNMSSPPGSNARMTQPLRCRP